MSVNSLLHANITDKIIGAFYRVYNELDYGFLESVYSNAMTIELGRRNQSVKREVPVEVGRTTTLNYLRATNIEVGMLLHFGPKAQYFRRVYSNSRKPLPESDPR